jgi:hypothetical protein
MGLEVPAGDIIFLRISTLILVRKDILLSPPLWNNHLRTCQRLESYTYEHLDYMHMHSDDQ